MRGTFAIMMAAVLALPAGLMALGAGTTNADFSKIAVGARASGMGQAFTAAADDASAPFWNPAGLALVSRPQASLMHLVHVADINLDTLSVVFPTSRLDGWGLSAAYLWQPPFDSTKNSFGVPMPGKAAGTGYDLSLGVSYAHNMGNFRTTDFKISNIALGGTLKLVTRSLQNLQSQAISADLGGMMEPVEGLRVALVAQGLGTTATFINDADPAAVNTRLGFSWNVKLGEDNRILLNYDLGHPIDISNPNYNRWRQNIGLEYTLFSRVSLRGGYSLGYDTAGLSAGGGVNFGAFALDYAFVPQSVLGNTHRVSADFSFGSEMGRPDVAAPNAPRALKGVSGDRLVSLAWEASPEKDVIGYNVYYSKSAGRDYVRTNEKPEPKQNSLNVRLANETTYFFVVTAVNAAGKESEFSDEISLKPHAPEKPKAPSDLKAAVSGRTITLTWKPATDSKVVGYHVYYARAAGGAYKRLTKAAPLTDPECRLRGLTPDASYYFVMTSVTRDGLESPYSSEISAKPRQDTLQESQSEPRGTEPSRKRTPINDEPF